MKKMLFYAAAVILIILVTGCSDEPPSIRTQNQFSAKANVQYKTSNNTINQNDVAAGITTNYQDISEGNVQVTATIQSSSVSPTTEFNASNNNNYTIVIINSNPPVLKVNSEEK